MKLKIFSITTFVACVVFATTGKAQTVAAYPPLNGGQSVTHPASYYVPAKTPWLGVNKNTRLYTVNAWEDPKTGAHGSMTRFDYGFVSPLHTHKHDYYGVVIKGVMENYQVGVKPLKMGPGGYWYQRGKQAHTTACVSKGGCLVFLVQASAFDAQIPPVEE
jgi:hypothetical protein